MNTAVKKILLTGSALVAVSFATAGAAQAQVQVNGSDQAVAAAPLGIIFQTNHTANLDAGGVTIGSSVGDSIIAAAPGHGTLHFQGGTNSVSGTIGAGNALGTIQVSGGATAYIASPTFNVNNISFGSGGGTLNLDAAPTTGAAISFGGNAGTVYFAAGSTYSGTATGNNAGTIAFGNGSTATSAALGTSGNALSTVNIGGRWARSITAFMRPTSI